MNLPTELTDLKQWICWLTRNGGQKIPKAINGLEARVNDPETWSHFEDAEPASAYFRGLAFVFSDSDDFCGVDLDNCLDENGKLKDWAVPIVARFDGVSYGEISPSGNGIKFITQGKKPDGARCVHEFGGIKEQVECYDHDRYWCITGDIYACNDEIKDGQRAVDWLCETYLAKDRLPACPAPTATPVAAPITSGSDILLKRVDAYLGSVPTPTEGQRNNSCFQIGGHIKAFVDDYGNSLSDDVVVSLIKQWASPCGLPPDEIEAAVRSSFVNGTLPAAKAPQERPSYSAMTITAPTAEPASDPDFYEDPIPGEEYTEKDKTDIPPELYEDMPGLLGDFYQWCMNTCIYPQPEPFLGASLALMSVITGNRIEGFRNMRSNLYCMTSAPTGSGKDHSRKLLERALSAADASENIGAEGFTSGSAIVQELDHYPVKVFQLDEFGQFLEQVASSRAPAFVKQIEDILCKLYTSSGSRYTPSAYSSRENQRVLDQPHCVIHATTTPDALWNAMDNDTVSKGLLGRFTLFEGDYRLIDDIEDKDTRTVPEEVIDGVKFWLDHNPSGGNLNDTFPTVTKLGHTPEALKRLKDQAIKISNRRIQEDPMRAAIWSRAAERTSKLAMIRCAARRAFMIDHSDVDWAVRLSNAMTRKLCRRIVEGVSESEYDKLKKRVLKKIRESGGLTKREVTRRTQFCRNARERDAVLSDLIEGGFISLVVSQRQDREVRTYVCR